MYADLVNKPHRLTKLLSSTRIPEYVDVDVLDATHRSDSGLPEDLVVCPSDGSTVSLGDLQSDSHLHVSDLTVINVSPPDVHMESTSDATIYTELASDTDLDETVVHYESDNDCISETIVQ